jgi:hypothetical protein
MRRLPTCVTAIDQGGGKINTGSHVPGTSMMPWLTKVAALNSG